MLKEILDPFLGLAAAIVSFPFVKNIKGEENLHIGRPFIIAVNHSSVLDTPITFYLFHKNLREGFYYIAAKMLFKTWFRKYFVRLYSIPVDRENPGKHPLDKEVRALNHGKIIIIFPEGRETMDGKLQKGHTGVSYLALTTGLPVVPVGLKHAFNVWPVTRWLPRIDRSVEVNIGKPLNFKKEKITEKNLHIATRKIMKEIGCLLGQKYRF